MKAFICIIASGLFLLCLFPGLPVPHSDKDGGDVQRRVPTREDTLMFEHLRLLFLAKLKHCLNDTAGVLKSCDKDPTFKAYYHDNLMETYLERFEGKRDIHQYAVWEKNPFKLKQARQALSDDIERVKAMAQAVDTESMVHPLHGTYYVKGDYDFEKERFVLEQPVQPRKYFGGFPMTLPENNITETTLYLKPDQAEALYNEWEGANKLYAKVHYALITARGSFWVRPKVIEFYKTEKRQELVGSTRHMGRK